MEHFNIFYNDDFVLLYSTASGIEFKLPRPKPKKIPAPVPKPSATSSNQENGETKSENGEVEAGGEFPREYYDFIDSLQHYYHLRFGIKYCALI